jgi:hypothetical protein
MRKNLLAVTAAIQSRIENRKSYKTLFWQVNTNQPTATSSHFVTSVDVPAAWRMINVQMNEKLICEWPDIGIELLCMKKSDIFSGIQSQLAEPALTAHSQESGDPWRRVKLDFQGTVKFTSVCLEPGNSSRLAVEINGHYPYSNDGSYILLVDLSRGEVIRKIETLRSDLHPASWCGGTLIFLQELRNYVDRDITFRVHVFDPSRVSGFYEQLEIDDSCLQSGLTVKFFGACNKLRMKSRIQKELIHVDFFGVVILDYGSLFIAAIC